MATGSRKTSEWARMMAALALQKVGLAGVKIESAPPQTGLAPAKQGTKKRAKAGGKTSKPSFAEFLADWREEIVAVLEDHYGDLVSRGRSYMARISEMKYFPNEGHIACLCQGSQRTPYSVFFQIEVSVEGQLYLDATCSCPYSDGDGLCKHTYAATLVLEREFARGGESPFVKSILGEAEPEWQTALAKLDQFLARPAKGAGATNGATSKSQSRFVWRVVTCHTPSYYNPPLKVEPVEQTPSGNKKGGWNKGRAVPWDRLILGTDLTLSSADLAVIRAAGLTSYQREPDSDQWGAILNALVGHPLVFNSTTPMSVRRGALGLSIRDHDGAWQLAPSLDGRPLKEFHFVTGLDEQTVAAVDYGTSELTLATTSPELAALTSSLMQNATSIPEEAQPEFLKRLPALEALLPVTLPDSLKGELIQTGTQLAMRIQPTDPTGARIELRATPAPDGAAFVPGQGPVEVTGKRDGQRVRVERDLNGERQQATTLASDLFFGRFASPEPFAWQIETDDDVLDLLDAIRARPENDPLVVWPEDAQVRRLSVLGEIAPSALKVEIKDQHDWFGLSGSIELGGQKFPLATLLAALRDGRRYVSLGQGQFASIAQAFRDRLASVADMLHSNCGKLEFNATAAPVIADLLDDQMTLKSSKKWKEALVRLNRATDLDPQVPTTLTADLRDYQVEGFKWLRKLAEWGVGGILADDMGLGKTVQALAVLLDRREVGPVLVVAPVSVGFNWVRETARFAPTLNPVLYRDTDRNEFLKSLGPGDMLITSYYLMQQHAEELSAVKWGTLVLDEAQYIKNSQTKTAQVVRSLEADWRLALTGTPCENHLGDLWSVFRGVSPGLFGSWERFREVFADPIEKGKVTERKQSLARVLRPFVLRRTKSEVLTELPPRTEVQLTAELSDAERRRYEDARLWAVTHLTDLAGDTGKDQRFQVLAALTKLRQLACHPRLVDQTWDKSSAKLDLFLETVDELREGKHRALVFSQFTSHLALIREALDKQKVTYQYLDGQTPPKQRQERVDAFQRGEGEFFLISLKAGGTGLNLTGADYVIHLDPWWNPAVEDQATDRAHRIGQTRPVTVYRLVAKDTIEEQILKLHGAKRDLVAGILEGTDQAAKLSTHELIDLIKLGGRQT
jgi:superfamily II DNA or RNA helicase